MRLILLFIALSTPLSWADSCEDIMAQANLDRSAKNIYFNRWGLPDGMNAETIMSAVVQKQVTESRRPLLIFDTNPDAKVWSSFNIIRPEDDVLFPGLTYRNLSDSQKGELFSRFYLQALVRLKGDDVPLLIFDHHFKSRILSDASTTPLVVDFLNWLNRVPESDSRDRLRETIAGAVRLRDHSDPDILLANAAANWATSPTMLKMYGAQIKRIAYFNDHSYLDPSLSAEDKREVILGYYLTMGFEKMIPQASGNFERALQLLDFGLERVYEIAHESSIASEDGLPELIQALKKSAHALAFASTIRAMEMQKAERDLFQQQMKDIYSTEGAMVRLGETVIVRFPPLPDVPSGLEVMQYLKAHPLPGIADAKYVAVVGRETHADGEYWHVKFRVLDGKSSLDPLIQAVREAGTGGGGRSTAGGLYAPAGKKAASLDELERDLSWALGFLR